MMIHIPLFDALIHLGKKRPNKLNLEPEFFSVRIKRHVMLMSVGYVWRWNIQGEGYVTLCKHWMELHIFIFTARHTKLNICNSWFCIVH
jgi:hypothetical protein